MEPYEKLILDLLFFNLSNEVKSLFSFHSIDFPLQVSANVRGILKDGDGVFIYWYFGI